MNTKKLLYAVMVVALLGVMFLLTPGAQVAPPSAAPVHPAQTAPAQPQATPVDTADPAAKLPPDPCSAVKVTATTTSTTAAGAPGFPDEGFDIDETVNHNSAFHTGGNM